MVFYGEYEVSITSGGRIALPKRIREGMKENVFVITKGFGKCLAGYEKASWEARVDGLLDVSLLEKENIDKRRVLFSSTVYLEIDDQGRIVLPRNLKEYAALLKKAIIVGIGDHFEIWEKRHWTEYLTESNKI
jgi:MraZ protein